MTVTIIISLRKEKTNDELQQMMADFSTTGGNIYKDYISLILS